MNFLQKMVIKVITFGFLEEKLLKEVKAENENERKTLTEIKDLYKREILRKYFKKFFCSSNSMLKTRIRLKNDVIFISYYSQHSKYGFIIIDTTETDFLKIQGI